MELQENTPCYAKCSEGRSIERPSPGQICTTEGSISVDQLLLDAADFVPHEAVDVWNINNGARLETYVIRAEPGSGEICLNGAAARLVHSGDLVITASFCWLEEELARSHQGKVVLVDEKNRLLTN
jgi:aspartate 1-decarboxylase